MNRLATNQWITYRNMMSINVRYLIIIGVILFAIVLSHIVMIDSLPKGLFTDESSIGYNAALIAETGVDEHGQRWPIYFKAFGEYKNPIYIYTAAIIFKLSGVSEFGVRFTSFLFFMTALLFFCLLIGRLFPGNRRIMVFALIGFGFLPQIFTLSRISFEVISQLTWVVAALYMVWMTFESGSTGSRRYLFAALCGLILGTSIYTYSTARLLSFLMCLSLGFVYFRRNNFKTLTLIAVCCLLALIPYVVFWLHNPSALTKRFFDISYVDDPIPIIKKVFIFCRYYLPYWLPEFLVQRGDHNLRHAINCGGMIYASIWIVAAIGIASIICDKNKWKNRFILLVLLNLIFSPVAAALTNEGQPHALRALLVGFYMLLLSCYGFAWLCSIVDQKRARILTTTILYFLVFEASYFTFAYFVFYPTRSIEAMGSYGTKEMLQLAIDLDARRIFFPTEYFVGTKFYTYIVDNPGNIPILMTNLPKPKSGDCLIYPSWREQNFNKLQGASKFVKKRIHPNWIERIMGVKPKNYIMRLRCY